MESLIRQLIPHAPHLGLYVAPDIPDQKLERALKDYATDFSRSEVIVLYDATRLGTGGDGALFTDTRLTFQNSNLQNAHALRYADIVGVRARRRLLGGRYVELQVNRGRATILLRLDFSARPAAAEYVNRFLSEAMLIETDLGGRRRVGESAAQKAPHPSADPGKLEKELQRLVQRGVITELELKRMLRSLNEEEEQRRSER